MADPAKQPPVGEVRAPSMDHALYPYRTLAQGPRFAWPGGARIAFTVTLMLDYWEVAPPPEASRDPRVVSPLGNFFPDWLTWSQREYGNRVGIFRVLEALDRFGVVPSVALGVEAARRYPELVDECARRGAAFMAHGTHATRRITSRMSAADEQAFIAASRAAVQASVGRAPTGWCGQDFNESPRTPALLAEAGFSYVADWSNDDRPYLIGPGPVVSLPVQSEWNDLECMWLRRVSPRVWADGIAEGFAVLHGEGGAAFNLTLHPWIAGQAHRVRYLADALSRVLGRGGVWQATTDAVAQAARVQL
ncbi:polysaccharide deacetylase family protein [Limobrevibacterium gyesilva]|uniref:Polysaccharide deacetylase family protein n=1 Tax=Limobrevibacterium gyesilva TaxID=2991712 RepID=A0AA41YSP9_9PROT|nr:polysaccharide deacetylase family protein [Limobrevibacterium gyesilva]MCW3477628.1 polysaccharide deacetylase family protein [Limobrevibacterium gyesilva]